MGDNVVHGNLLQISSLQQSILQVLIVFGWLQKGHASSIDCLHILQLLTYAWSPSFSFIIPTNLHTIGRFVNDHTCTGVWLRTFRLIKHKNGSLVLIHILGDFVHRRIILRQNFVLWRFIRAFSTSIQDKNFHPFVLAASGLPQHKRMPNVDSRDTDCADSHWEQASRTISVSNPISLITNSKRESQWMIIPSLNYPDLPPDFRAVVFPIFLK